MLPIDDVAAIRRINLRQMSGTIRGNETASMSGWIGSFGEAFKSRRQVESVACSPNVSRAAYKKTVTQSLAAVLGFSLSIFSAAPIAAASIFARGRNGTSPFLRLA
jgi:hypothetical protein